MQPWSTDWRFYSPVTFLCDKNLWNYNQQRAGAMRGNGFRDFAGPKRRKSQRRPFAYPAELRFENELPAASCLIVDMSETGAQLEAPPETNIHDEFILLIGAHTSVRRRCQVIWRSNSRIGVRFFERARDIAAKTDREGCSANPVCQCPERQSVRLAPQALRATNHS